MTYAREQAIAQLDMAVGQLKLEITRRVLDPARRASALVFLDSTHRAALEGLEVRKPPTLWPVSTVSDA